MLCHNRRELTVLTLLAGAGVAAALVALSCGGAARQTTEARITLGGQVLDVWRDPAGRLTFRWEGGGRDRTTYDPATRTRVDIVGGAADSITKYASSAVAWGALHMEYGVTPPSVAKALASGHAAVAPPSSRGRSSSARTDYGTDLSSLAAAVTLSFPRLTSLGGYALADASSSTAQLPGGNSGLVVSLDFGLDAQERTLSISTSRPFRRRTRTPGARRTGACISSARTPRATR
ncbi:MAG TPA: hypothetical protein VMU72_10725 [Gaiellaceae bacterium]|nr:hypothetical protein [Gaiellaceae bacterium]